MDTYVSLLQSYAGRDKVMRTAGYTALLLASSAQNKTTVDKLSVFARQISAARTILRLFDDVPMWKHTLSWSSGENDWFARLCANVSNISSAIYLPLEHIAWSSDQKILSLDSANWWGAGTACWAISLFLNVVRSLRRLYLLSQQIIELRKRRRLESPEKRGAADEEYSASISRCRQERIDECLNFVKNFSDLLLAVNLLPWKGILWAGKFSTGKNASFGTISSLVGLYIIVKGMRKAKTT